MGERFGGRKKGTPNKATAAVKEAMIKAFDEVGGADYLVKLAKSEPKTFAVLLAKLIPTEIEAEIKDTRQMVARIPNELPEDEWVKKHSNPTIQ